MSGKLRWGFLSAGAIANAVAQDFQIEGLTIQAVGARELSKSRAFGDTFSIPNCHDGYESLVNDPEVDIVYVSTLPTMHHRDALLAIEAGKHVLIEKPFTINAKEAREIREAAHLNNVFVMEAMWTRFLPSMTEIFNIIQSGLLGEIQLLVADHSQFLPDLPRLNERALGGGALLDLGIYPVSLAVRLLGRPENIVARATLNSDQVDSLTSIIFQCKNGSQANLTTCMSAAGPVNAIIVGTKGRIEIDGFFFFQTNFTHFDVQGNVLKRYTEKIDGVGRQYQATHVEECINNGLLQSSIMSIDDSVEVMEVMDAIRRQTGVIYPSEIEV